MTLNPKKMKKLNIRLSLLNGVFAVTSVTAEYFKKSNLKL